jgi:hypothetical protein
LFWSRRELPQPRPRIGLPYGWLSHT